MPMGRVSGGRRAPYQIAAKVAFFLQSRRNLAQRLVGGDAGGGRQVEAAAVWQHWDPCRAIGETLDKCLGQAMWFRAEDEVIAGEEFGVPEAFGGV